MLLDNAYSAKAARAPTAPTNAASNLHASAPIVAAPAVDATPVADFDPVAVAVKVAVPDRVEFPIIRKISTHAPATQHNFPPQQEYLKQSVCPIQSPQNAGGKRIKLTAPTSPIPTPRPRAPRRQRARRSRSRRNCTTRGGRRSRCGASASACWGEGCGDGDACAGTKRGCETDGGLDVGAGALLGDTAADGGDEVVVFADAADVGLRAGGGEGGGAC